MATPCARPLGGQNDGAYTPKSGREREREQDVGRADRRCTDDELSHLGLNKLKATKNAIRWVRGSVRRGKPAPVVVPEHRNADARSKRYNT